MKKDKIYINIIDNEQTSLANEKKHKDKKEKISFINKECNILSKFLFISIIILNFSFIFSKYKMKKSENQMLSEKLINFKMLYQLKNKNMFLYFF